MTIQDIIDKKLSHIDQNRIVYIDGINAINNNIKLTYDDISQFIYGNTLHIYLKNISRDYKEVADMCFEVITHRKNIIVGTSIYVDDQDPAFIDYCTQKFKDNDISQQGDHIKLELGLTIQHIIGVGYILSIAEVFNSVMVNTYSPEEYMELLDKYIIVAIAKQEEHYIKDWVAYHLRIGFDKIYLYDNNDIDGESYNELLKEYVDAGRLKIIDVRGKKGLQNYSYNASYYAMPYKWMAIIDIDEFIWFNETGKYNNIKTFIDEISKNMNCYQTGIMLQWHSYAASGDDKPSDLPIWQANPKLLPYGARKDSRCEYIHDWSKSIYRSGYALTVNEHFGWDYVWNYDKQYSEYSCNHVGCDGKPLSKDKLISITEDEFLKQDVYVKHFLLRNIDDFYRNKYLRGHAGADFGTGEDGWRYYQWFQNINYFTDILGTLTEKEQIYLAKHGMKMNYTFHPDILLYFYVIDGNDYVNTIIDQRVLIDSLIPNANVSYCRVHISGNNFTDIPKVEDPVEITMESSFLVREVYSHYFNDAHYIGDLNEFRYNIQEPIVMTIGIPAYYMATEVSPESQKYYADFIRRIFNTYNFRNFLRSVLDNNLTIIPSINTSDNDMNCGEFKEPLIKFINEHNLYIPQYKLNGNTMIMSYRQFIKVAEFMDNFKKSFGLISNTDICKSIREGKPSIYDAYTCAVLSVIDNPYFVWPA
jgi:hypothetical protein